MTADGAADADEPQLCMQMSMRVRWAPMYMTMTGVRPGLFFQREGPGSEPGNSLLCPDEAPCSVLCRVLGIVVSVERAYWLLHKQHRN